MRDAYRTSGMPCPQCPGASLRTFANRYICDECGGMMLDEDDLWSSLRDLTSEDPNPRYDYGDKTSTACPLCERAFSRCAIVLDLEHQKKIALDEPFLRCEQHGVWCAGGVLERVFTKVSRAAPRLITSDVGDPAIGPDGLPEGRFVAAAPRGRMRPDAPAVQPVDPYADRTLWCPVCTDQALNFRDDRWSCAGCQGVLVGNDGLVAMVQNIAGRYWELPPAGAPTTRMCPVCASPLAASVVEGIAVSRCEAHGVWFTPGELAEALKTAADGGPKDGRSWFARLLKPRG